MNKIAIFLLAALALQVSCTDISALNGSWEVIFCVQTQYCGNYYNYTFEFNVDQSNKAITNQVHLLNGTQNQEVSDTLTYSYSQNNDGTYDIKPTDQDGPAFVFTFYKDNIGALQRNIIYNQDNAQRNNFEVYGIIKYQSNSYYNAGFLSYKLHEQFPNLTTQVAGYTLPQQIPFQLSSAFQTSQLFGQQWFVHSFWQLNNEEKESSEQDFTNNVPPMGGIPEGIDNGTCYHIMFTNNWTNPQIGQVNKYNLFSIYSANFSGQNTFSLGFANQPDPKQNSWIHSYAEDQGIVYADNSTIVILSFDKQQAAIYSTTPQYSTVKYALFVAQIVKAGINPLNGKYYSYNNSAVCDPNQFTIADLEGKWQLAADVSTYSSGGIPKSQGCFEVDFVIDKDAKTIALNYNGYDFAANSTKSYTNTYTYNDINSRSIYSGSIELIILAFTPDSILLKTTSDSFYQAAEHFVRNKEVDYKQTMNHFAPSQIYPGLVNHLPYGPQCVPFTEPIKNVTSSELEGTWNVQAVYAKHIKAELTCGEMKISKNTKINNYIDIEVFISTDYLTVSYTSTNSWKENGYLIPQITNMHGDPSNPNKTELFFVVKYFDGNGIIFAYEDPIDYFAGEQEVYFASKSADYTPSDEEAFQKVIGEVSGGTFNPDYQTIVNNKGCSSTKASNDIKVTNSRQDLNFLQK